MSVAAEPVPTPAERRRVEGTGTPEPWSHLVPVVEAEQSWGNRTDGVFRSQPDGWYDLSVGAPLHLDLLRTHFTFPDHIVLGQNERGQTWVLDAENRVKIVSASRVLGPRR